MKGISLLGVFLILLLTSCNDDGTLKINGDTEDSIQLSQKEVNFSSEASSTIITTEGEFWWIDAISLNGNLINFDAIDTAEPNFVISEPQFNFERKNATEIHIKMTKNTSGELRLLTIALEAGNYFDGITVTQAAE